MSVVDDIRKLLQDLIAPELSAIKESIDAHGKIADARFQAAQSQYAALQTHLDLIKQQMKNNHDAVMDKLNTKEAAIANH